MIELEKLYDCADRHLLGKVQDWDGFASDFQAVFSSEMALYHPTLVRDGLEFLSMDELVATTNPEMMAEFFEKEIIKFGHMFKEARNPLEPFRRSDVLSDDQFRNFEVTKVFLEPNGVFFLMIVHAILPDGSLLVLDVWRSERANYYSDIEKQRLALFMRYLASLIRTGNRAPARAPDKELIDFGTRYKLTEAEVSILSDLLQGKSLKLIAQESGRSYGTVRWHVHNILEKCQVKTQKNLLGEFYRLIKS